jgi:pimeloyl-ACP methyl ester carboxylesterase
MLSTIAVPVLVTCGERDAIAPLALSREIATAIPGAELETIPNAGHVANADNPAAFNTMLAAFLSKVRSR